MPIANPTLYPLFSCVALVMPFPRDTIVELRITLVRLSGAKGLRDPLVSKLLGEWVASSPLARARWSEAADVGYPCLICTEQVEADKIRSGYITPAFLGTGERVVLLTDVLWNVPNRSGQNQKRVVLP